MEIKKFFIERIYLLAGIMGMLILFIPILYFRFHEYGQPNDEYLFTLLLMFFKTRADGTGLSLIHEFAPEIMMQFTIPIIFMIVASVILIIAGIINKQKIVQYILPAIGLTLFFIGFVILTNSIFAYAMDDGITFMGLPGLPLRYYYQVSSGELALILPHIGYYLALGFAGASAIKYLFYGKPKE